MADENKVENTEPAKEAPAIEPKAGEAPKVEGEGEGKEGVQKEMTTNEYKEALKDRDDKIDALETGQEEIGGKMDSMQESLDSALEEIALKGGTPEADPTTPKTEPAKETEVEGKTEEKKEVPAEEKNVEKEIDAAITEDQKFRDEIMLKEELRDLKDEIKDVKEVYPEADENEVLLNIEDGIEEDNSNQIEVLAKASHEKHVREKEEFKNSIEGELKAKIQKESEGDLSVPQSGGSPPATHKPEDSENQGQSPLPDDREWDTASQKAKADSGE